MYKKKVFGVLVVASLLFIVGSLIVSSACCLCPEKQVKIKEIPVPWQSWVPIPGGVTSVIQLPQDFAEAVVISRDWAAIPQAIELEDLMWDKTEAVVLRTKKEWMGTDEKSMQVRPGGKLTLDIPVSGGDTAVVARYTVALASAPDDIVAHVITEAVLEPVPLPVPVPVPLPVVTGWFINPTVTNDTGVQVDNLEVDLYGAQPSDVNWWYNNKWRDPPEINKIPGGTEVKWKDPSQPLNPGESIHFGLALKSGVEPTSVRVFWTRLCP